MWRLFIIAGAAFLFVKAKKHEKKALTPPPTQPPATNQKHPVASWHAPSTQELAWSDRLFISGDCGQIATGGHWAANQLTPLVQAAVRVDGEYADPDAILMMLLDKDAPQCGGAQVWGPKLQAWYNAWRKQVLQDISLYVAHPEFLP